MATESQIKELRGLIQEPNDAEPWTNAFLGDLIDRYGITRSASSIWKQKASSYVEIVNISEGGSSRSNSDIHKHALEMVKTFNDEADAEETVASARSRTRRARRA